MNQLNTHSYDGILGPIYHHIIREKQIHNYDDIKTLVNSF